MTRRFVPELSCAFSIWLVSFGPLSGAGPRVRASTQSTQGQGSNQIYQARRATTRITIDGHVDEPAWARAAVESHFTFPWTHAAPRTEFRALWDDSYFYFAFRMQDSDVVVVDHFRDERDAVFEDRAEIFFSRDEQMHEYFCIEIDSRGRVYDYRAAFYRRFDPAWTLEGLQAVGATRPDGYEIEGRIPLTRFPELGVAAVRPGARIRWGLYRAEFSHDRSGSLTPPRASLHTAGRESEGPPPIEDWASWIDPHTKEPDFHVPASLGWLAFVE